nr:hypothetical protein [Candidatus Njordarchaeota archaeon]
MSRNITGLISRNKLFSCFLIMTIVVAGSSFVLTPAQYPNPQLSNITVPGKGTFVLAAYPVLDRRVIGLVNLFRDYYDVTDFSNASVNGLVLTALPPIMTHYFLAFTTYGMAEIIVSTPGFRTSYYMEMLQKLIAMMNSSTVEQIEWIEPGFTNTAYSSLGNGFRGPTNIMWTGHYTLMELLYYDLFRDPRYNNEIKSYMDQWNASLTATTKWNGSPSNGLGRWGVGLIPCEPYIVFVQCNSIPFYAMRLYDKLHATTYQQATLPGIEWWYTDGNMVNDRGIPIDGYYVAEPSGEHRSPPNLPPTFPGPSMTTNMPYPKVSAYGSAWITMFYNAMGYTTIANTIYGNWKSNFVHYSTDDTAYVVNSYYFPNEFGAFDFVGNVFAYFCAHEMEDQSLFRKLENWFYSPFEGKWNGYKYEFDTSVLGDLSSFAYPVVNFAWAMAHAYANLTTLMNPQSDSFFTSTPYISNQSTTEGLFVYQAYYDTTKSAFILTVESYSDTVLTFSNFPGVQGVYTAQGSYPHADWVQNGNQMMLTLHPGTNSFVIY